MVFDGGSKRKDKIRGGGLIVSMCPSGVFLNVGGNTGFVALREAVVSERLQLEAY